MGKFKDILTLSDPYPNFAYEVSCYLKAIIALIFIILGFFFILSPIFKNGLVIFGFALILAPLGERILSFEEATFGQNFEILSLGFGILFILLGLYLFWRIKLVRKLVKALYPTP
ncbi:MAG: hypothetical protein LiPW16_9 [Microgenomates group bacterium LiPW_16]|nr:MAG: hypothetical protein LiPW16_9 [Microgenomates group bacterium LiPW_16]